MSVETIQEQLIRELTEVKGIQSTLIKVLRGQVASLKKTIKIKDKTIKAYEKIINLTRE